MNHAAAFRRIVLCLAITTTAVPGARAADPEPLAIGAAAPDFALPGVDGETHTLGDYADAKVLVIVFTCNHCPTAQAYEERIKQLVDDYEDRGVQVVAISPNDAEAVRLDELGYADLGDSLEDMKIRARRSRVQLPLPLRRRHAGDGAGVRAGHHAARVHLRRRAPPALPRPHRRPREPGQRRDARRAQRHRGAAGRQAGSGRDHADDRLLDQVVGQAGVGRDRSPSGTARRRR